MCHCVYFELLKEKVEFFFVFLKGNITIAAEM